METEKKIIDFEKKDTDICYSRAIKAGKRIYYLDVKKSRNDDLYLAITESKKKVVGFDEDAQVTFEKHKIFLYKEDFEKFIEGLEDVVGFIKREQGEIRSRVNEPVQVAETIVTVSENISPEETKSKSFFNKFKF